MKIKINKLILAVASSLLIVSGIAHAGTANTSFGVHANIQGDCTVIAEDLDFGVVRLENGAEQSTYLTINCPIGLTGLVHLDGGLHLVDEQRRLMQNVGGTEHYVNYSLYSFPNKTREFSTYYSPLESWVNVIGDGTDQVVDIYGVIPIQPQNAPGDYYDTIQVRVDY